MVININELCDMIARHDCSKKRPLITGVTLLPCEPNAKYRDYKLGAGSVMNLEYEYGYDKEQECNIYSEGENTPIASATKERTFGDIRDHSTDCGFDQFTNRNQGWKYIADTYGKDINGRVDILQFETYFNRWQKQAILLAEISYAETFTYLAPIGVFTHIGTLARALQNLFEPDWKVNATLVGDDLNFYIDKSIKAKSHTYVCKFVELDQTNSNQYHDGWAFGKD